MEQIANLHIELLPEGVYLATSDDIPGLVAQGRTITETLEITRDVAENCWRYKQSVATGSSSAKRNAEVWLFTSFLSPFLSPLIFFLAIGEVFAYSCV